MNNSCIIVRIAEKQLRARVCAIAKNLLERIAARSSVWNYVTPTEPPTQASALDEWQRKAASTYYEPVASALRATGGAALLLTNSWLDSGACGTERPLGAWRRRMLERAAATLGAFVVCSAREQPSSTTLPCAVLSGAETDAQIEETLRAAQIAALTPAGVPGLGRWRPEVGTLVVAPCSGAISAQDSARHNRVLLTFASGGVAAQLCAQLAALGPRGEDEVFWVNAYARNGDPLPTAFLSTLRPRRVITIGLRAHGWAQLANAPRPCLVPALEWPYATARHPLVDELLRAE